ncbi:MAG: TetR/AcrR family transcriptional regulator [Acidobacteriia bacterium]|nr:TetR/AcrR family transcriptional regulator [Terriglobia bacterium]
MATEKLNTGLRQEQIAQAVLGLIATRGAKGLSVAAVARRVGLVPSALYRHFENKDQMLKAAIDLFQAQVRTNFEEVERETPQCLERLHRLLRRQVRMIRENQVVAMPRIIFSDNLYGRSPQKRVQVYRILEGFIGRLSDIIVEGKQRGEIHAGVDPPSAARIFLAIFQSSGILWFLSDGEFDVTNNAEKSWRIFKRAIEA